MYTIPPDPYFLTHTRAFTRSTLLSWKLPDETIDTAEAIVSELVTNAIVHTKDTARLRLILDRRLRIEVADTSRTPPRLQEHPCGDLDHGLGLLIVERYSAQWGHRPTPTGKDVWSELTVSARRQPHHHENP